MAQSGIGSNLMCKATLAFNCPAGVALFSTGTALRRAPSVSRDLAASILTCPHRVLGKSNAMRRFDI
jgi:hypothetical protein